MITKKQYLKAKKIVDQYEEQNKGVEKIKMSKKKTNKPKQKGNFFSDWDNFIKNVNYIGDEKL